MMQSKWFELNKTSMGNTSVDYLGFEYAIFGLIDYTKPEGALAPNTRENCKCKQFRSRWVN